MKTSTIFRTPATTYTLFIPFGKYLSLALLVIVASTSLRSQSIMIAYDNNDTLLKPFTRELGHFLEQATKRSVSYSDHNSSGDGNINLVLKACLLYTSDAAD